jgi:hypothetical protein
VAPTVADLARCLVLGALLDELTRQFGGYELLAHWTQGEFHHDVVLRVPADAASSLPGDVLVVATNCNGGIKEARFRHVGACEAEVVPVRLLLSGCRCREVGCRFRPSPVSLLVGSSRKE